ncbi:hypothetical protein [Mucilaginibacter aquaedulcis]|uniref:hypothetical protein n=1 Tax=Mucilaginibacter aquaedulcis TaxID=1187081 RepID=UPI0025B4DF4A|nr:hypothetical protein [Mucilaginibacter aquaedulcis]MDN3548862.1 hypothetical protein [Mucilaginibacter aquaedulcis]
MPNHLSVPGIVHTVISVIAVVVALYSFARFGKLNPENKTGKWYIGLTLLACFSSFLVMKTGHLSSAHGLSVLVLTILPLGVYTKKIRIFGNKAEYVQLILMSATLFFSLIPAIVETLTRLPVSQPIASSDQSPEIKTGLLILVSLYTVGVSYQIWRLHSIRQMRNIYNKLHI